MRQVDLKKDGGFTSGLISPCMLVSGKKIWQMERAGCFIKAKTYAETYTKAIGSTIRCMGKEFI